MPVSRLFDLFFKTGPKGEAVIQDVYFLLEYPIFRELDDADLQVLAELCEELRVFPGEVIFRESDPGNAMYIIKSGVLEVYQRGPQGKKPINILSAGEFFGEMALIDGSPRSAEVAAQEEAVVVKLSREGFERLKKEFPQTGFKVVDVLLKTLSFRLRRSTKKAVEQPQVVEVSSFSKKPEALKRLKIAKKKAKSPRRKPGNRPPKKRG